MSGPFEATGRCRHGVVDDICGPCTIDGLWQRVTKSQPTKHLTGEQLEHAFGVRFSLAEMALQRQPLRYLEVGVRRGHSLALVCQAATVFGGTLERAIGIDAWIEDYGGEDNPGPDSVRELLEEVEVPIAGEWGTFSEISGVALVTGDSHELLPRMRTSGYLFGVGRVAEPPTFNLIYIDGDHTPDGARRDLEDAFELLEPHGLLVFDDAVAGGDNSLLRTWRQFVTLSGARQQIREQEEVLSEEPAWCWLQRAAAPDA